MKVKGKTEEKAKLSGWNNLQKKLPPTARCHNSILFKLIKRKEKKIEEKWILCIVFKQHPAMDRYAHNTILVKLVKGKEEQNEGSFSTVCYNTKKGREEIRQEGEAKGKGERGHL